MLCMQLKEIFLIYCLVKYQTLRQYKPNFKGCFKVGSVQMIKKGMFDKEYCFKVRILNRYYVNINQLTNADFNKLGYKNKAEYLKQPYNIKNESNLRILYEFEIIEVNETRLKDLKII